MNSAILRDASGLLSFERLLVICFLFFWMCLIAVVRSVFGVFLEFKTTPRLCLSINSAFPSSWPAMTFVMMRGFLSAIASMTVEPPALVMMISECWMNSCRLSTQPNV